MARRDIVMGERHARDRVSLVPPRSPGGPTALACYRGKDKIEVAAGLKRASGAIVGIKVDAGATARPDQFRGSVQLRDAVGDRRVCGILLHDGDLIQRAASGMFAMPVKMLREA